MKGSQLCQYGTRAGREVAGRLESGKEQSRRDWLEFPVAIVGITKIPHISSKVTRSGIQMFSFLSLNYKEKEIVFQDSPHLIGLQHVLFED